MDNLWKSARKRLEQMPPLQKSKNNDGHQYTCDACSIKTSETAVVPLGLSWRSGWVILCKACHFDMNIRDDLDSNQIWEKWKTDAGN